MGLTNQGINRVLIEVVMGLVAVIMVNKIRDSMALVVEGEVAISIICNGQRLLLALDEAAHRTTTFKVDT